MGNEFKINFPDSLDMGIGWGIILSAAVNKAARFHRKR
jgi:hypothetical protein